MPLANYEGRIFNLPFNMNTFYQLWKTATPAEAQAKIASQREAGAVGEPRNLEEQAISLVGKDIYELLIKGYTEKQWGRPAVGCRLSLSAACRYASLTITTISTILTREFPWAGTTS